jgi:peptidoglycan/xylan/chitin deacetylase (PgdA/CDA1 family)/UDP-N-acetylglucosamine:LPS N-acetylglucosamine transferase
MNILMALSQKEVTGAETYAVQITEELINRGYNVTIVSDTLTKQTRANYIPIKFNNRSFFDRISQVYKLVKIIKKYNIQIVHAHSRASSWSAAIACKLTNTVLIVSVHGRQSTKSISRKIFKAFGDATISVNEDLKRHLINDFKVQKEKIYVVRNGVKVKINGDGDGDGDENKKLKDNKKIISIIGRLSGPKGIVCKNLLEKVIDLEKYNVQIIGGNEKDKNIIEKYLNKIDFVGYVDNVEDYMKNSTIVIGAGRVAIESFFLKIPLFAIGEEKCFGRLTKENILEAFDTNFGDFSAKSKKDKTFEANFDWAKIKNDFESAINIIDETPENFIEQKVYEMVEKEFNLEKIVDSIEKIYQHTFVEKHKYEIPILMYHRVISDKKDAGSHGIFVYIEQFEDHLKILKEKGFETITFEDLKNIGLSKRFDKNKKYIILTFDDGYKDNFENVLPLLRKYKMKAVIYLTNQTYNVWDVENFKNRKSGILSDKKFELMNKNEILEIQNSGLVEFGGHTVTHHSLKDLNFESAKNEIMANKFYLEEFLGKKLISFSYPYGEFSNEVKNFLEKESDFKFATTTDYSGFCISDDVFAIRRIAVMPKITKFGFKRKIAGNYIFKRIERNKNHI